VLAGTRNDADVASDQRNRVKKRKKKTANKFSLKVKDGNLGELKSHVNLVENGGASYR